MKLKPARFAPAVVLSLICSTLVGIAQSTNYTDEQFRDEVSHRAFLFFIERSNPTTGLTQDRANKNGSDNTTASIATTGWYLCALPIGVERGWISYDNAKTRALSALHFLYGDRSDGLAMPNTHGFFKHFVNKNTGASSSEVSSIDTAICISGVLICGQYFGGDALDTANKIYNRVDWEWMRTRNGNVPDSDWVAHGYGGGGNLDQWGFIEGDFSGYSEALSIYLLGIGATSHKLPNSTWAPYAGLEYYDVPGFGNLPVLAKHPTFIPQQPQNFYPFQNRWDRSGYNFWNNAFNSALIHRQYCWDHSATDGTKSPKYLSYGENFWGLNACDHQDGYKVNGAPNGGNDGTVCPTGPLGYMPFNPQLATAAGQAMYQTYAPKIWGKYGFCNAYNVDKNWYDADVIGIDLGMMLCNVENQRSGLLWRIMGMHPATYRAYTVTELHPVMTSGATYVLQVAHSGKVIGVPGGGTANGVDLEQRTATGSTSERWMLQPSTNASDDVHNTGAKGYWTLINVNSGKCIEVDNNATTNGAPVQQWNYFGSPSQEWSLIPAGQYSYALVNRNSGLIVDVASRSFADGAKIQQWSTASNPQTNQIWKFYEVPTPPADLAALSGDSHVTLKWTPRFNATSYSVYARTKSNGPVTLVVSETTNATVDVTGLVNQVTYYFAVAANNGPALGDVTNFVGGTPWAGPPSISIVQPIGPITYLNGTNDSLYLEAAVENSGSYLYVNWFKDSGPGPVSFTTSNLLSTAVKFSAPGVYSLKFMADNGTVAAKSVTVVVNPTSDPTNGLLAWWKMNESGGSTATDSSGNSRNLAVSGATFATGYLSNALDFNGTGNVAIFDSPATTQITLSVWVKADTQGNSAFPRIIETPGYRLFLRFQESNGVDFATFTPTANGDWFSGVNTFSTNAWHHIAASYDRSNATNVPALYVDGVRMPITVFSQPSGALPSYAGTGYIGNHPGLDRAFDGKIDDFRIYNRLLSDSEVTALASQPVRNIAPIVSAGDNQLVDIANGATLSGIVSDDGNPVPPNVLAYEWTQVSGPGQAEFTAAYASTTGAYFSEVGDYVLRLAVSDGQATTVGEVTISVVSPPLLAVEHTTDSVQISWDSSAADWRLQFQTNAVGAGLGTNWLNMAGPVTNPVVVPYDPAVGSAYYRLILQKP